MPPSTRSRRPATPLNAAALERLALRYVERFATTRGKLAAYLNRKLAERGWDEEGAGEMPDTAALSARLAELGYVDDRGFADMTARSLARRGYGPRRVAAALHAASIAPDDATGAMEAAREDAWRAALALARRRRIGPFADAVADPPLRRRQLAMMIRAGHEPSLSHRIVTAAPGETLLDD